MSKKKPYFTLHNVRNPRLVQFRDRGCGGGDASVRANYQKVAVGHLARSRIDPHENVYPVLIFPKSPDLHHVQVGGLAQGAQDVFADQGVPLLTL